MRFTSALILWVSIFSAAYSQEKSKHTDYADVSVAFASYKGNVNLLYVHTWQVGKSHRTAIGVGARLTSFVGANQYYITAPSKLTSESTSPLILFKENIVNNIDSLLVKSPQINALNLCINIDYRVNAKLMIGFNIDALGFSLGGSRTGNYINGPQGKNTTGRPTVFNVLLISDNDRGTLNSELFGRYFLNDKWGVKAGLQFLFTEYTTKSKVQQVPSENDRFRNKALLFSLGVTYKFKTQAL